MTLPNVCSSFLYEFKKYHQNEPKCFPFEDVPVTSDYFSLEKKSPLANIFSTPFGLISAADLNTNENSSRLLFSKDHFLNCEGPLLDGTKRIFQEWD